MSISADLPARAHRAAYSDHPSRTHSKPEDRFLEVRIEDVLPDEILVIELRRCRPLSGAENGALLDKRWIVIHDLEIGRPLSDVLCASRRASFKMGDWRGAGASRTGWFSDRWACKRLADSNPTRRLR